jgi:hypothetical protein
MFGRLLRILVGLAVLAAAVDIWNPSLIPQGYGVPVRLGDFEDLRQTAIIGLGVVGAAFVIAGLVGSGRKRRVSRSAPSSTFALPFDPDLEGMVAPAPTTLVTAPASLVRPTGPAAPAVDTSPAPHVEPAPLEQTSTAAWIPAAMPVLANAPLAAATLPTSPPPAAQPAPAVAPAPSGSSRAAFVSATEAGDRLRLDGQLDEAMEHYARALDLARAGLKTTPSDVQAHADLAAALTNVGDVHDAQGQLEPALAAYEESLTFHRALAAHSPDDRAAQRGLSLSLEKLADTREARGHRSRALDLYRESLPIAEKLAAAHPGDVLLIQDLATTKERLASLQAQMT